MNIELTNEQFKELLLNVEIGLHVRESVYTEKEDERAESLRDLGKYLLGMADKFGCADMVCECEGEKHINDETTDEEIGAVIDEFLSRNFWDDLITELGQRDLGESLTEDQIKTLEEKPESICELGTKYFEKYEEEFEEYGVGRLRVVEK